MNRNLDIVWTKQFKKDYKLAMKRSLNIDLLDDIIRKLARGEQLPEKNKDHALTGNWVGHRECHIQSDWLLVYRIEDDLLILTLSRTGTHSDLFGK
ncbi:MAG TPA: type II toxin-antitoxin system mRNA interferase toxin, RelE/StbE family [Lachnospiraceae bacterium]|nr:type II toxin-antitoxin system mRNA interferase toxin, RelE/StbE family [Lachnospiraceae bacterium]